jgi:hypothetical protein
MTTPSYGIALQMEAADGTHVRVEFYFSRPKPTGKASSESDIDVMASSLNQFFRKTMTKAEKLLSEGPK